MRMVLLTLVMAAMASSLEAKDEALYRVHVFDCTTKAHLVIWADKQRTTLLPNPFLARGEIEFYGTRYGYCLRVEQVNQ